jgi:hypothetical protein
MHLELRRVTKKCWSLDKLLKTNKSGANDEKAKGKAHDMMIGDSELLHELIIHQPELFNKDILMQFMLEKVTLVIENCISKSVLHIFFFVLLDLYLKSLITVCIIGA